MVDLSSNQIMKVEEDTFTGLTLSLLDLSENMMRRVPGPALRKLVSVDWLRLDSNPFLGLETGALQHISGTQQLQLRTNF